jgi:hypothetical protein
VPIVAGVDLGGTAINYTIVDQQERFLIDNLCEHPALSRQGPDGYSGSCQFGGPVQRTGFQLCSPAVGRLQRVSRSLSNGRVCCLRSSAGRLGGEPGVPAVVLGTDPHDMPAQREEQAGVPIYNCRSRNGAEIRLSKKFRNRNSPEASFCV